MLTLISGQDLQNCLAQLEPIELKATVLLREHRSQGQMYPRIGQNGMDRKKVIEAVHEIREYTARCDRVASQLEDLSAIALPISILEYGL